MFVKPLAFTFMSTDSRRVVSKAWNFAHEKLKGDSHQIWRIRSREHREYK